jgi:hypothetical protein
LAGGGELGVLNLEASLSNPADGGATRFSNLNIFFCGAVSNFWTGLTSAPPKVATFPCEVFLSCVCFSILPKGFLKLGFSAPWLVIEPCVAILLPLLGIGPCWKAHLSPFKQNPFWKKMQGTACLLEL